MSIGLGISNSISGKISGFGGGYDPDAKAFFTAIEDAGGTLSDNVKAEYDAFVLREKENSRYSKLKRLYPYLGGVIDSARVDAITLGSATNNNFVDADADSLIGLQSDGSTKALKETQALSTITTDQSDLQWYSYYLTAPTSGMFWGVRSFSAPVARVYTEYSGGNVRSLIGVGVGFTQAATLSNGQSLMTSITDVGVQSNLTAWIDGSVIATKDVTKSTTLTNREPAYFAYNLNGTINTFSSQKSACNALFQGMSDAELVAYDASYKTFLTNIQAYAAAQAYFAAVEGAGGTLSTNVKSEFTSFVTREIENNRWDKIKRLYPYLGGVIDSARVDAITLNSATNNNFVDGDVDSLVGLTGDGSTKSIIESGDITNIITDDYNFAIGFFAKDPVGVTSSGAYYTEYFDGSNRIAIRRLFNSIGAYPGAVSTYFYDGTDITAESNWSFIMGQYTSNSRSILFNGTNVKTDTQTNSNPATGFIGDPYKYYHYKFTYGGQSNSSFISQGMSETELIAFDSSYKTFLTNIEIAANGWWNGSQTGLLDSYPSASAAYSVRALNSAYTGALLRVRRSSDNAEQDIHAMADGNLDTTSLLSFVGANDGFVVTWYDQSGNGDNATNATAVEQPRIVVSGTLQTENSKPVIIGNTGTIRLNVSAALVSTSPTQFSVSRHEGATNATGYCLSNFTDSAPTTNRSQLLASNGSTASPYLTAPTSSFLNGSSFAFTNRDIVYDNTITQSLVTLNWTNPLFTSLNYIGTSFGSFSMMSMQEFILYDADKLADRTDIESNIITYYGIS